MKNFLKKAARFVALATLLSLGACTTPQVTQRSPAAAAGYGDCVKNGYSHSSCVSR